LNNDSSGPANVWRFGHRSGWTPNRHREVQSGSEAVRRGRSGPVARGGPDSGIPRQPATGEFLSFVDPDLAALIIVNTTDSVVDPGLASEIVE
jgi:hypothetical protein